MRVDYHLMKRDVLEFVRAEQIATRGVDELLVEGVVRNNRASSNVSRRE
jgi:hypothetical protein